MKPVKRVALHPNGYIVKGVTQFKTTASDFEWQFPLFSEKIWDSPDLLKSLHLDGIIAPVDEKDLDLVNSLTIPVVNTVNSFESHPLPTVTFDDYAHGKLAAEHLLSKGFVNFYYIGYFSGHFFDLRFQGFREKINESGHKCQRIMASLKAAEFVIDGAGSDPESMKKILQKISKPAAIFAENDYCGFTILEACRRAEIKVPEEICVLGVDNEVKFCCLATPELSSIDRDEDRVGFEAARMLETLMKGETLKKKNIQIPPKEVVQRTSTDILSVKNPHIVTVLRFIHTNVHTNIKVDDVLVQVPVSRRTLEREFKKTIGSTIFDYIQECRLKFAEKLLINTDRTVEKIAYDSGYPNVLSMQKAFNLKHNMAAHAYRLQNS